jgi:hypothetical protein
VMPPAAGGFDERDGRRTARRGATEPMGGIERVDPGWPGEA